MKIIKFDNGSFEIKSKDDVMDAHEFFEAFTDAELYQMKITIGEELAWRNRQSYD